MDTWLSEAWKRGGGNDVKGKLESLKGQLKDGKDWQHPGLFVETVGEFMKRILNKDRTEGKGTTFDVKGTKKVIEKVGFTKNESSGGLRLALGIKEKTGEERVTKYIDKAEHLCVLSVEGTNKKGRVDFIVGFYEKKWRGDTTITVDGGNSLVEGYDSWCERRAPRFEKEKNLVVGIPFNNFARIYKDRTGGKIRQVEYDVRGDAASFVGLDFGGGYSRVYATKSATNTANHNVWPVILGVVGWKKSSSDKFEEKGAAENFSEIYWGGKRSEQKELFEKSKENECGISNKDKIGVPVGVKFSNVKVTGKTR